MSVESYIADDLFIIRTVKSLTTNPDNRWANTYEIKAVTPGSTDELLACALKFIDFEKEIHIGTVKFVGLSISTWDEDSVPYNPSSFISSALSTFGTRSSSGNGLGISSCLSVARVPPTGRLGHLFYRGVLLESDVEAPAGKTVFTDPVAMADEVELAIGSALLGSHIGLAAAALQLVMVSKDGGNVRPVVGLVAVGVSQVPSDHAWYNRTAPTP